MSETVKNVFEGQPAHGTVVGIVSEERMTELKHINDRIEAIMHGKPANEDLTQETYRLAAFQREWWLQTCKDSNIPYVWPIRISWQTGEVYIDEKK